MLTLLHEASKWLEDFSGRHAHIIALLEAVSTTTAVIVALTASYAARHASQPRLKAAVSAMQVIYGDGRPTDEAPTYIAVRLTNVGTVPVRLHSSLFSWMLPFEKTAWLAMPVDKSGDRHVTPRRYPFVLLPRTSETVFLTAIDRFKTDIPRILDSGRFGRKISAKLLRGIVYTDDGSRFRASFDGSFRKELAALA